MGLAFVLVIASCKKEDVKQSNTTNNVSTTKASQWKFINNWSSSKTDSTTTIYFSKLTDSSITGDVVKGGLVLLFKKTGDDIQALPFLEKDDKTYWYYQVSKGSIRINIDNNSGENLNAHSFSYFVVTQQKLSELEANGNTKLDLLQLSYDQATTILK